MRFFLFIFFLLFFTIFFPASVFAKNKIVNVYAWVSEIPPEIVRQFEKETGIRVNFATYQNNETLFAKIRTSPTSYDVIVPSSYFVDRMRRLNMLEKIDKTKIPNWKNLNPAFLHPDYDPKMENSVPFVWGVTGIFVNQQYFSPESIAHWSQLWEKRFDNQLMLLDDTRENFSIALITLGYSPNDKNPEHIKAAFLKLKTLMKNTKVFSTETVVSMMIDEDVTIGSCWNGDAYRALRENPNIKFILPKEGFMIWIDSFSIPRNAPHKEEAYAFINFITRADIAKEIAEKMRNPTANLAAQRLLPKEITNNPIAYPPPEVMKHVRFQTDLGEETLNLYEKYWEELKMGGGD